MSNISLFEKKIGEAGISALKDEPMSRHTTFRIGGKADMLVNVSGEEQLSFLIKTANECSVPYHVIGRGSNILVSDDGVDGVVMLTGGMDASDYDGALVITAGAGMKLSSLCDVAAEHALSGLEFAWGIPGSVGGAVYMNAGAYNADIGDVVYSCRGVDGDGEISERGADEMRFGYRSSFSQSSPFYITRVVFRLFPGDAALIRERMNMLYERRREKQPLEFPSAGSVFKRPSRGYASEMIEGCGLKGYTVGGAQVSEKHAGFIINKGNATASDVRRVIEHIRDLVFLRYSVKLEPEIRYIGRSGGSL